MLAQVEKTQSAVKKEQGLAAKLKEEISAVNNTSQKQMQLEKEKVEATEAERSLVEKSLKAERQKVSNVHPWPADGNVLLYNFLLQASSRQEQGHCRAAAPTNRAAKLSPCCSLALNDAVVLCRRKQ